MHSKSQSERQTGRRPEGAACSTRRWSNTFILQWKSVVADLAAHTATHADDATRRHLRRFAARIGFVHACRRRLDAKPPERFGGQFAYTLGRHWRAVDDGGTGAGAPRARCILEMATGSRRAVFAELDGRLRGARLECRARGTWTTPEGSQCTAAQVARAAGLDMWTCWTTTKDSDLGRVPKALVVKAVREGAGTRAAGQIADSKKDVTVADAEQLLAGTGWLPSILLVSEASYPADFGDTDGLTIPAMPIAAE
jgi:hypothetical protein